MKEAEDLMDQEDFEAVEEELGQEEEDETSATKGRDGGLAERADEKQVKHSNTFTFSVDNQEK